MTFIPERDSAGGLIGPRVKSTITGWHVQMHAIDFTTSTINGFFNKSLNPVTLAIADLGYVTYTLYAGDGTTVINDQPTADTDCRFTVIDWNVDYEMEIFGAAYRHGAAPASDCYLWVHAAPGIANKAFAQGGVNLKHLGAGQGLDLDGKSAKYISPDDPVPGVQTFRATLYHPAGLKHNASLMYLLYKL